ncbi:MAG TPA: hypothetical protein VGQ13_07785 [Nitrososphaera sp.]|jgi:hypothetical protein|nr:hypothetical protein [Nitrososphaera sp.]
MAGVCLISASVLLLPSFVLEAYATPIIPFEPLDHVYNLTIENQTYPIKYGFSAEGNSAIIEGVYANYSSKSITVIIDDNSTTTKGNRSLIYFMIELPRSIIDANTTELAAGCTSDFTPSTPPAWVQEHDLDYNIAVTALSGNNATVYSGNLGDMCGQYTRTLSIEYPTGIKSMIVIQGTVFVPEFGSSVVLTVMLLSIISAVLAVQRFWQ